MYSIAKLSSLIQIEIYTHLGQVWHKAKAAVSLKCILKPTCAYTGSTFGFLSCCSPVRYLEIPAKAQNSQILLEKNCWNWMNTMQGQQEDMGILTSIGLWTRKHSFCGIKISDLVSLLWCFKIFSSIRAHGNIFHKFTVCYVFFQLCSTTHKSNFILRVKSAHLTNLL